MSFFPRTYASAPRAAQFPIHADCVPPPTVTALFADPLSARRGIDSSATVFRPVALHPSGTRRPGKPPTGPLHRPPRQVPAAPDLGLLEAAQAGQLAAMRSLARRHNRVQAACDALPRVASRHALRSRVASACDQLCLREAGAPPVVLIGERYGCTASVDAVDQAVGALQAKGVRRGRLLLEYCPALGGLLQALEAMARQVVGTHPWHFGLVDALVDAFRPLARAHWARQGRPPDERLEADLAREWAPHALALLRARDAGFEPVAIDKEGAPDNAERERHMRTLLQRYGDQPLIVLTGGLHTPALLPAIEHGNFVAIAYGAPADRAYIAELTRRAMHQGLSRDARYHQWVLADRVADGDLGDEGDE